MNIKKQLEAGLSNLSREEVIDLIQTSPDQALLSPLVRSFLSSGEFNYIVDTFEKLTNKDAIVKQIKDLLNIPAQIKVRIYPHKNIQEVLTKNTIGGASVDIPTKKLNTWKDLSDDPDFFVDITADIKEESIIRYTITESDLTEISSSANKSSRIVTAILAGSLILGVALKSNIIENLTKSIKNVTRSEVAPPPERTFLETYPLIWAEVSKLENSAKYLANLNSLSNADIEAILKENGMNDFSSPSMATNEEKVLHIEHELELYVKNPEIRSKYANLIFDQSENIGIDYRIMTSIIRTESHFNHAAVSSTGDVSVVQINPEIWNYKEWLRIRGFNEKQIAIELKKIEQNPELGKEIFDLERLKKDPAYAIERFGEILKSLNKNYAKKDKYWYARYHSKTCNPTFCPKLDYAKKVNSFYNEMNAHLNENFKIKIANISNDLKELKSNPKVNLAVVEEFEKEIHSLKKLKSMKKRQLVAQK